RTHTHTHLYHTYPSRPLQLLPSIPTRRSSDLTRARYVKHQLAVGTAHQLELRDGDRTRHQLRAAATPGDRVGALPAHFDRRKGRSEEHTSELQSQSNLVCRLLLEKKKQINTIN